MLFFLGIPVLFALYLFLIAPSFQRRGAKWRKTRFAHRGLYGPGLAENSMEAFEAACRAGYGIELDVQLSSDGQLMVFHDAELQRVCGVPGRISEKSGSELQNLSLSGMGQRIPRLEKVLEQIGGRVPLLIELKTGRRNRELCEKLWAELRRYDGPYIVESFNPLIVGWFRRNAPGVLRGLLISTFSDFSEAAGPVGAVILSSMLLNVYARPDFIAYNDEDQKSIAPRWMRGLFRPLLAAWTMRDLKREAELHALGEMTIFEQIRPQ